MPGILDAFFFKSLPDYFTHYDSYKGPSGGLLQRFLGVLQEEFETETTETDKISLAHNPEEVVPSHLRFLSENKGKPPQVFRSDEFFIKTLKIIPFIHFERGTEKGVEDYFKSLGVQASLVWESNTSNYDDEEIKYDLSSRDVSCSLCRYGTLELTDPNSVFPFFQEDPIPAWSLVNLIVIMEYLLPINAFLRRVIYDGEDILDPDIVVRKFTDQDTDLRISALNIIRRP